MTLRRKLLVPLLLIGAALGSALGYLAWDSARQGRRLEENAQAVRAATALALSAGDAAQDEERWILSMRGSRRPSDPDRLRDAAARVEELATAIRALALAPGAAALWAEYEGTRGSLLVIRDELVAAAPRGDPRALELALEKWDLLSGRAEALLRDFTGYHLRSLDRAIADLQARRGRALRLATLAIGLGLAVAVAFSALLARAVVQPIAAMAHAAERVTATGELSTVAGAGRNDEIGTLARSFNRMTEQLLGANAELSAADRRKDEFLAVLSHELRNPLAPIRLAVEVLHRADPAGAPARRAREVIERQVSRMGRLIDDLLDATRISRGKISLHRDRVDLVRVVAEEAEDLRPLLASRGVILTLELPRGPVHVDVDATRVGQIVGNLLQNAAKFIGRGGAVRLSLAVEGDAVRLRVRDDGIGIEPALLPHVFEPFVQAERSLARSDAGLGLGLALVKGLTELHGGRVAAASDGPGAGAEFTVELPLAAVPAVAEAGAGAAAAPPEASVAAATRRVLVVDDNVDAARSLAELLELSGHSVAVVFDGPAALARAREEPPDVILCDLGLPGMSGFEVARAVRADPALAGVRLVAVSGYAQPEDRRRTAEAGFDGHVAKPADPAEVERLIG